MARFGLYPLALCVFASTFASAQGDAPKQQPPKPQAPRTFQLKKRTHYVLSNGMQVNLLQYGSVPKATIHITIGAGAVDLDTQHTGLPSLASQLMLEGTQSKSGAELARMAADMGGSLYSTGGTYRSALGVSVLSESSPAAIALLGDILEHPAFPSKDFERLRADSLRDIAVSQANPSFRASQKYAELMYGNQPNGHVLPTEAMVKSFTLEDVKKYYDTNFGAQRAAIYVVGQFDEQAIKASIKKAFEDWRKGLPINNPVQKVVPGPKYAFVDQPGAAQSNIMYGIEVADASSVDAIPFQVMNLLLGGSFGSRITSNIREQKGYSYSPRSSVDQSYRVATWQESAAVTAAATGASLQEIDKEIKRLQTEAPPQNEVNAIQRFADGSFLLRNSNPGGIISQLSFVDFHGLSDDYLTNYTKNIDAVSPTQVQEMAKKYLKPESMTLVVVGDPAVAKPQLASYESALKK